MLLRKKILQKSQPPLYPCQLSEYVCSGGGVRHIGYTCERMENEKLAMKQQLSKYERDLQAAKKEIDKVVLGEIINIVIFFFS